MFGVKDDAGVDVEVGILQLAAAHILTLKKLNVTVIELTDKNKYDLVDGVKIELTNQQPKVKIIQTFEEFKLLVQKITSIRAQKPTNQNHTSSRSHLIFILTVQDKDAPIVFADLAGFESAKDKENMHETKYINSTLSQLNQVMLNISRNQIADYGANELTKFLKPYLKKSTLTLMLYHLSKDSVQTGLEYVKDVVPSRKPEKRNGNTSIKPLQPTNRQSKPFQPSNRQSIR